MPPADFERARRIIRIPLRAVARNSSLSADVFDLCLALSLSNPSRRESLRNTRKALPKSELLLRYSTALVAGYHAIMAG